jgi:hypothetical protein
VATKTITINVCDRCGAESDAADYMAGNAWGQMTIDYHGDTGGRAYDGAAAGLNHKGKKWLCMACTDEFLTFMRGKA